MNLQGPDLYVILSRVICKSSLVILSKFTDADFDSCKPKQETLDEDNRLIAMALQTCGGSWPDGVDPPLSRLQRMRSFQRVPDHIPDFTPFRSESELCAMGAWV